MLGCRLSFMLTMLWTIQLIFILDLNIVVQTEFLIRSIYNFISAAWRWRYRAAVVLLWRLSPLWLQWPAVPGGLQSSLDPRLQWWPAVPGDLQGSLEPCSAVLACSMELLAVCVTVLSASLAAICWLYFNVFHQDDKHDNQINIKRKLKKNHRKQKVSGLSWNKDKLSIHLHQLFCHGNDLV